MKFIPPWRCSGGIFDKDEAEARLAELNAAAEAGTLWDEPDYARRVMRQRASLEAQLKALTGLELELSDTVELLQLAEAEEDDSAVSDAEQDLRKLAAEAQRRATEALLSGEADSNDCFLEIHAGAGGTESQDWAEMMLRMYLRWAVRHECGTEELSRTDGEEAGLKSVTVRVSGADAYGWLKTESGVHRLVRISPFDAQGRRHTSFASVWIYPVVDEDIEVEVEDKDLKVDTYRASGAGGQHVNKSDSAVRITHKPTGIVVQCQSQRSQHQNRATALRMLKARLFELELQKREEERQAMEAGKTEIGWGHQIRSYVLQPHQMVKDLRTGVQTSDPQAVLDGDLDAFLSAALAARLGGQGAAET